MEFARARDFISRAGIGLVRDNENNVIGVAIGGHGEGPIATTKRGEFCLVAQIARFEPNEAIARERALKACLNWGYEVGISVGTQDINVVEIGDVFRASAYVGSDHGRPATLNTQKWFKTLRPGIGIANASDYPNTLSAGTIGFFVAHNGKIYLVSCNHVIARANQALQGEPIVQPATLDLAGSDISDHLLTDLRRRFLVAELAGYPNILPDDPTSTSAPTNVVDVGLAEVVSANAREQALSRLPYAGKILGEADPYIVDDQGTIRGSPFVYKVGRTTGFTEGYVSELGGVQQVHYDGWTATFVNQIGVRRTADNTGSVFSDTGDSGSALLTDGHRIAGLIFAGGPRRTLANPIGDVMNAIAQILGPNPVQIII